MHGCEHRGPVPAAGAGLQLPGLVRPGASKWGDWDASTATGQTGCLSPARWREPPCTCFFMYIPLMDLHPSQPERRAG